MKTRLVHVITALFEPAIDIAFNKTFRVSIRPRWSRQTQIKCKERSYHNETFKTNSSRKFNFHNSAKLTPCLSRCNSQQFAVPVSGPLFIRNVTRLNQLSDCESYRNGETPVRAASIILFRATARRISTSYTSHRQIFVFILFFSHHEYQWEYVRFQLCVHAFILYPTSSGFEVVLCIFFFFFLPLLIPFYLRPFLVIRSEIMNFKLDIFHY